MSAPVFVPLTPPQYEAIGRLVEALGRTSAEAAAWLTHRVGVPTRQQLSQPQAAAVIRALVAELAAEANASAGLPLPSDPDWDALVAATPPDPRRPATAEQRSALAAAITGAGWHPRKLENFLLNHYKVVHLHTLTAEQAGAALALVRERAEGGQADG